MAGIRADLLEADCHPVRDQLPRGAVARVRCVLASDLVNWAAFYAYSAPEPLLAAYEADMTAAGIPLRTELPEAGQTPDDCWRGYPWEDFYWPRGDVAGGMNRAGCFVDESGVANLRYLWDIPRVYIEVVGATPDIAALRAWSWYDSTGGEPQLGGPGLWQPESLPSGEPTY